jgi:hypothetical protein
VSGPGGRPLSVDPEAAYYQTIEEFFVGKRGDPLFLSNADWNRVRKWRQAGIPLRVVLRGIADALDGHALSWSGKQKVGSLAYCAREVESARDNWAEALAAGDSAAGVDLAAVLTDFAAALGEARGLGPRSRVVATEVAEALRARVPEPRGPEIEAWLGDQEARLVAAIEADDGASVGSRVAAEAEAALAPYRSRLPAKVMHRLLADSKVRRLLERHGLPRLSLFHLEPRPAASAPP